MTYEEKLKYLGQLRKKVEQLETSGKQGMPFQTMGEEGVSPSLGHGIGVAAKGAVAGAVGIPGDILNLARSGGEALAGGISNVIGLPQPTPQQLENFNKKRFHIPDPSDVFPTGEKVKRGIDYLTGGQLTPQTKGERYLESGTEALGSMALPAGIARTAAKKGIPALSKAFRALGSYTAPSIGGAIGAGTGAQYAREDFPNNPVLQGIIPLLTGTAGAVAGSGVRGLTNIGKTPPKPDSLAKLEKLSAKYKVPLSAGELAQDAAQQAREETAILGSLGAAPKAAAKEFKNIQKQGFEEAVKKGAEKIAGELPLEKGENIGRVAESLREQAKQGKETYTKAYKEANPENIKFNIKDVKKFSKNMTNELQKEGIGPNSNPESYNLLKDLNQFIDKSPKKATHINFNGLEQWRKGVNAKYASSKPHEKRGMDFLRRGMDDFIDKAVNNSMIEGDLEALTKFKQARGLYADWMGKYGRGKKNEAGKNVIADIVEDSVQGNRNLTNEQITNKILGTSTLGFHEKATDSIKEIKKLFGADSKEFMLVKSEALNKLLKPLEMGGTEGIHKGDPAMRTYHTNLNKFVKENSSLSKELFDEKDMSFLKDLGTLGSTAFEKIKSKANPSNTGLMASVLMSDRFSKFPGVKDVGEYINALKTSKAFTPGQKEKLALSLSAAEQTKSNSAPYLLTEALKSSLGETGASTSTNLPEDGELPQELTPSNIAPQNRQTEIEDIKKRLEELKKLKSEYGAKKESPLMKRISQRESGGNPKAKNKLGYLGQYQFGAKALEDVGLIKPGASKGKNAKVLSNPENWTIEGGQEAFLNNPGLQKQAMSKLMLLNRSRLKGAGLIKPNTNPQAVNGMLSAAHLGGVGGVKALLRGSDRQDAFGTPVSEYYKRGYRG